MSIPYLIEFDSRSRNRHRKTRSPQKSKHASETYNFLKNIGLQRYYSVFEEQEIDRAALQDLSETDLEEVGIKNRSDRQAIMAAVHR